MATIRLGAPGDLAALTEVFRRASLGNPGDRDLLLAHPEYLVLRPEGLAEGRTYVAERDGVVVGFVTWAEVGGTVELEDLFVDPPWTRRGIATELMEHLGGVLRDRGVQRLEVTANPHASEFYASVGFAGVAVAQTPGGPAPRLVMDLG